MAKKQWDVVGEVSANVYVVNVIVVQLARGEVVSCRSFVGSDQDEVQTAANDYFLERVKHLVSPHVLKSLKLDMVLANGSFVYSPWAVLMPNPEITTVE